MPAKYCRRTDGRAPSAASTRPCRYACGGSCAQRLVDPRPGARHEVAAVLKAEGAVLCHPDVRALRHASRGGEGGAGTRHGVEQLLGNAQAGAAAGEVAERTLVEIAHPCRRRSRAQRSPATEPPITSARPALM